MVLKQHIIFLDSLKSVHGQEMQFCKPTNILKPQKSG